MKKTACITLALLSWAALANAQVSTKNVLENVIRIISKLEDAEKQVLFVQVDNIKKGSSQTQTYYLKSGNKYGIIAVGDDARISDIDLIVYDENGNNCGQDNDDKNVALVEISPKWDGKFKFKVSPYTMSTSDGFYGIIVYRKD